MADLAPAFPWTPSGEGAETRKSLLVRQLVLAFVAMGKHGMLEPAATLTLESAGRTVELWQSEGAVDGQRVLMVNGKPYEWDAEEQLFAALNELFLLRAVEREAQP